MESEKNWCPKKSRIVALKSGGEQGAGEDGRGVDRNGGAGRMLRGCWRGMRECLSRVHEALSHISSNIETTDYVVGPVILA